jgi:hypothetical protein
MKNKDELNEPEATYNKNPIQSFSSFEESNEANAKQMAAMSPIEHLKNVTALIKQVYKEELKEPMDKKIHFA